MKAAGKVCAVTDWLNENKDRIEVFYLPPYSPEINPDEYLNRDLKTMLRASVSSV
jgi:transposase